MLGKNSNSRQRKTVTDGVREEGSKKGDWFIETENQLYIRSV
jgi:hypothetical protein